jgi:hypothetical protein
MTLGEALVRLAELHPHFFNSFYRRVRVVRESPRPMPAAATIDVTHRCALKCPFCIAADVLDQRDMSPETFSRVCAALSGIGRVTLIGGEPFQHPHFTGLVATARQTAGEVEIFTNGLALGTRSALAPERLLHRIPGADSGWLTLVLSVDPGHANQMSPGRLRKVVDGLIEAEAQGICRARFSVTHPALATGVYLDTDTVTTAIGDVAPRLADLFMARLETGQIQETFYFNSVICALPPEPVLGRDPTVAPAPGPEVMRLEDLTWSPEVAVSFGGDGEAVVYSSLAAMWSNRPPPDTCLGGLEEAGPILLHRSLYGREELRDQWLPASTGLPEGTHEDFALAWHSAAPGNQRDQLLRAYVPFHHIMAWDGGHRLLRERLQPAIALVESGIGDRVLRFGGDEGEGSLETLAFRTLLEHVTETDTDRSALAAGTAAEVVHLCQAPHGTWVAPKYTGARELLGKRVPLAPGEAHSLARVHLPQEPGFGPRDELVLRPVLELFPDRRRRLRFPGISPGHDASYPAVCGALTRLLEMIVCLAGQRLARAVYDLLPDGLRRDVDLPEEVTPQPCDPDDLLAAFVECTYDRNRQRPDEDNAELLTLLLVAAPRRYSKAAVSRFAGRSLTWLERIARKTRLSPAAQGRLLAISWRGAQKQRVARLLARTQ